MGTHSLKILWRVAAAANLSPKALRVFEIVVDLFTALADLTDADWDDAFMDEVARITGRDKNQITEALSEEGSR